MHSPADLLRVNAESAVRGILLPKFEAVSDDDAALESSALAGARRGFQAWFGGLGPAGFVSGGPGCFFLFS